MSASVTHDRIATVETHGESHHGHGKPGIMHYIWNTDHKMIAMQFMWSAVFFLLFGGAMALAMRWQLAFPGHPIPVIGHLLPHSVVNDEGAIIPSGYNVLVTMHGTILVFFVAMPLLIGVFGNFLIPLKIAADDHQTFNAKLLADAGAAAVCPEDELTVDSLAGALNALLVVMFLRQ